jgi:hypothetical protein
VSSAVVGQARYKYQELVCLELFLRFLDSDVACLVEPPGGEDALLSPETGSSSKSNFR